MPVRKSPYRQPLTPEGIKGIEKGTIQWFDPDMYANLNTGALEQYMDEKNQEESFKRSQFHWKNVAIGIIIGVAFAVINQYVGLKVGIIISGAWYLSYIIGLALKWSSWPFRSVALPPAMVTIKLPAA